MDMSNHCPVEIEIEINSRKRITTWRLNSSILNGRMRKEIKDKIKQYMEDNDNGEVSPPFLWDACKVVLRGRIIAKTAALKKNKQQELINLEGKLEGLQRKHKKTLDPNITKEIQQLKSQINTIQTQGILKNRNITRWVVNQQNYWPTN